MIFSELLESVNNRLDELSEEIGTGFTGGGTAENEGEFEALQEIQMKLEDIISDFQE